MRKPRKSSRNVWEVLPAVAVSVVIFVTYCILNVRESQRNPHGITEVQAGGFPFEFAAIRPAFRRMEKRREGRNSQVERRVKLPDPAAVAPVDSQVEPLYSGTSLLKIPNLWDNSKSDGSGWKFLTKQVRELITVSTAGAGDGRSWDRLVLHHSSSQGGNATMIDMYHRTVRGIDDGLAYHFVVGNGVYSGDGEIEVGLRWLTQANAGTLPGNEPSPGAISICLVGDFATHPPTLNQLRALDELAGFLNARLGRLPVATHRHSGDGLNSCPGRYFPGDFVLTSLNHSR